MTIAVVNNIKIYKARNGNSVHVITLLAPGYKFTLQAVGEENGGEGGNSSVPAGVGVIRMI